MNNGHRAKAALEAKQLPEAIELYTKAIGENATSPVYYIGRSTAYQRSHEHDKALQDAEKAVVFAKQRAKRELIAQAQLRRAIVFFNLQQYGNARACLEWSKQFNDKEKTLGIWESKVNTQLKALSEGDEKTRATVTEVPDVDVSTPMPAAKAEPTSNGTSKAAAPPTHTTTATASAPAPTQTPRDKIRHDWYQSNDTVTFTLLAKGVSKDEASVDIEPNSLSISFPLATGSSFEFSLDPLFATVDPAASSFKVLSTKIEVVLQKVEAGIKWKAIEGTHPVTSQTSTADIGHEPIKNAILSETTQVAPSYPTSSRNGPKNWDKIASSYGKSKKPLSPKGKEKADDQQSPEADDDDGYESGADDPNFFFKKLYAGASDDVKRAMMKSYQESGGTALSTNWEDVSKARVPIEPPDGLEAHEWEGARSKGG